MSEITNNFGNKKKFYNVLKSSGGISSQSLSVVFVGLLN